MAESDKKYLVVLAYKRSTPVWQVIKRDGTVLHQCKTREEAQQKCQLLVATGENSNDK